MGLARIDRTNPVKLGDTVVRRFDTSNHIVVGEYELKRIKRQSVYWLKVV